MGPPELGGPIGARARAKHVNGNGLNPIRILKWHLRREKGPTRGPGGLLVVGQKAHVVATWHVATFLGDRQKIEVVVGSPESFG